MEVSGEVRDLIGPGVDAYSLDRAAIRSGMTTMLEDAVAKCRAGVTSVAEALRVTTVR
jgi:general secretion pathway protein E